MASNHTIGRLSLYRRALFDARSDGARYIFSHELARRSACTPAQVRRDIMMLGYTGSPVHGYDIEGLTDAISGLLDGNERQGLVLVGAGNLGRALLANFVERNPRFSIVAAFDTDEHKTGRVIHGCHVYALEDLDRVVHELNVRTAILAVPTDAAQETASRLIATGITGILNFAPVRLYVPGDVYVENVDMTMSMERVAYHARQRSGEKELVR